MHSTEQAEEQKMRNESDPALQWKLLLVTLPAGASAQVREGRSCTHQVPDSRKAGMRGSTQAQQIHLKKEAQANASAAAELTPDIGGVPKQMTKHFVLTKFILFMKTHLCFTDRSQYTASLHALIAIKEWQSTSYVPIGTSSFNQNALLSLCFDHLHILLADFQITVSLANKQDGNHTQLFKWQQQNTFSSPLQML